MALDLSQLEGEVAQLRTENERLKIEISSFMSIKRSARLLLGNIRRRIKHSVKQPARRLYWLLKQPLIDYKVSKIAKRQLASGNKIPKLIHYIWVGGAQKPETVEKYIKSWKKHCPDYEIIEWNEKNYNIDSNRYAREAYAAKKWAFVTDYVRLDVIDRFGGIYMDSDVEVLKNFDKFLMHAAFSSFEAGDPDQIFLPTGMMASEKNGKWAAYLKSYYSPERSFFKADGEIDTTTNTYTITNMTVGKYGVKLNNKLQENEDFVMYPSEYFCPKSWSTREINLTENTHAIHHFAASWLPPELRQLQHKGDEQ